MIGEVLKGEIYYWIDRNRLNKVIVERKSYVRRKCDNLDF